MKMEEVIDAWNARADGYNQWNDLGSDEQVEFTLQYTKEILSPFEQMLSSWRSGKPVVKICYALGNDHMEALDRLFGD